MFSLKKKISNICSEGNIMKKKANLTRMNLFKGISLKHHNSSKDIEFGSNSKEEAT